MKMLVVPLTLLLVSPIWARADGVRTVDQRSHHEAGEPDGRARQLLAEQRRVDKITSEFVHPLQNPLAPEQQPASRFRSGASAANRSASPPLPMPARGRTLSQCVEKLNAQGGGWCALDGLDITKLYPTDPQFRCVTGPRSIFIAWGGWAWDSGNKIIYLAANGGHADYCGNEVYKADLAKGTIARLTNPAPYTEEYQVTDTPPYGGVPSGSRYAYRIPPVSGGPASAHTYDGVQFSRKTGTIFWRAGIQSCKSRGCEFYGHGELWEFNPATLKWKLWKKADGTNLTFGRGLPVSAELPGGDLLMGGSGNVWRFDPADPPGTLSARAVASPGADWGEGNAVWDAARQILWFVTGSGYLIAEKLDGSQKHIKGAAGIGTGLALGKDGNLYFFDGYNFVVRYRPGSEIGVGARPGAWRLWDWSGKRPGRGYTNVYSKWVYDADNDVFITWTDDATGPLVYKQPSSGGKAAAAASAQDIIDKAPAGGTVTIPAGLYAHGIRIGKPLTVRFAPGTDFVHAVAGKAKVLIKNVTGSVVLDGFSTTIAPRCGGNCAGVKIEGADFDVTIRNCHNENQEMGILTDNKGGKLTIDGCDIGNTGGGSDLSHVVYVGNIDSLTIRNSVIHDSNRLGHLVKSRAAATLIEDSKILGNHSRHSRMVEAPCGGRVTIRNTLIQQSDQTDNAELMMIGGAPKGACEGPIRESHLILDHDTITSDRDKSADEPARNAGPTALLKWRAPNAMDVTMDTATREAMKNIDILAYMEDGTRMPLPAH